MKRRNFLKRLFGIGVGVALASVSAIGKETEETFKIDDIFEPCDGNGKLYFLKTNSWLENKIRDILDDRFVDEKYFSHYCPLYNCYLPIKDEYTKKDFENLLLVVKSKKFNFFCDHVGNHGKQYGAMRIFKDDGYYRIDMYQARNPNNLYDF